MFNEEEDAVRVSRMWEREQVTTEQNRNKSFNTVYREVIFILLTDRQTDKTKRDLRFATSIL